MIRTFHYTFLVCISAILMSACHVSKKLSKENAPNLTIADKEAQLSALFADACSNRLLGKFNEAEWHLKQCEKLDPTSAAVQYEMSNLYRLMNRREEALQAAEKSVKYNPDNIWYHYNLIKLYEHNNQYEKAIAILKNLIKKYPTNQELYKQLVLEYELNNQPEKALDVLDIMEKRWGYSFDIMYEKVSLYYYSGKTKYVENELNKYLQLHPDDYKAKETLAGMFYKNKEYAKALELANDLLSNDSLNSAAHLIYYDYYMSQENMDKALYHLNKIFSNPDYEVKEKLSILITLYSSSMKMNSEKFNEGLINICKTFVATHPLSPESHSIYADYLLKDGKKEDAIAEYYKAAILSKNKYAIWDQLLSLEYEAQMTDSLLKHSDMALEIFPNQAMFYVYKGIALKQKKNYEEAIKYYKIATDYAVDNNNLLEIIYTELAETYHQIKNYPESDKYFEYALVINPDNSLVLNNYAYYLAARKEKLDKAEKMSKRSLELSPDNSNYIDTYAWILYQQQKYTEAESVLRSVAEKSTSPTILEHYGDILYHLNRKQEAVEYWKKSKEKGNDSGRILKKIETQTLQEE